jgi:hypothetical protein
MAQDPMHAYISMLLSMLSINCCLCWRVDILNSFPLIDSISSQISQHAYCGLEITELKYADKNSRLSIKFIGDTFEYVHSIDEFESFYHLPKVVAEAIFTIKTHIFSNRVHLNKMNKSIIHKQYCNMGRG